LCVARESSSKHLLPQNGSSLVCPRERDGHRAQPRGFSQRRSRHCLADAIDLRLIKLAHLGLRPVRRFHKITRLLY
jgi:hypothetical protein